MDEVDEDAVAAAAELAREVAPDLDAILLTIYRDAETLRPGGPGLGTANAIARAVAETMAEEGVAILVQRADRAAFRRWLSQREDTPEVRRRWVDRERLLRGADAHRALGLEPPPPPPPPPRFPPAPGPTADRLLLAHAEAEGDGFAALVGDLLETGRGDVLELAIRKLRARQSDENAAELRGDMLAVAAGAAAGPSGWAELVALPVALPMDAIPDAAALASGLAASGALAPEEEIRFLPGWRSPDAAAELSPVAMRRVLLDLAEEREPPDLPPGDTDDLARRGFGLLVGLRVDWDVPLWDEIEAEGDLPAEPGEDTPEGRARDRAFDRWRAEVAAAHGGCVPLALLPLPEAGDEIADFLDEAGGQVDGLAEIREFVAVAERESGGEEVVCRPAIRDGSLELTLYTVRGRYLDSLALSPDRLPASAEGMLGLLGAFVRLVDERPGRGG